VEDALSPLILMKLPELDRLLREAPASPAAGLADSILSKLPGMRFVIPGSHPGLRILFLAGILGLGTALAISLAGRKNNASTSGPPPLTLFQPGAVEPRTASTP
jgi:hypothetical protein